jgi:hypothetical protein
VLHSKRDQARTGAVAFAGLTERLLVPGQTFICVLLHGLITHAFIMLDEPGGTRVL